ncbi:MAG: nucleotidyl transferase AbiEii/AbiGii toxin family protein [bacterium]|nr:nucleotidyl transferase AbiEii/AbiGii toxin family protein [bacterium]
MAHLSELGDVLPQGTAEAWPIVAGILPEGSTLMGGTGLAIWIRHRRREDLDFFTPTQFDSEQVIAALSAVGEFNYDQPATGRSIRGTFNTMNVDIVAHEGEYVLGPPLEVDGLHVGSLQDIAAGKLRAIATRRQLRAYVDVMFVETLGGINLVQAIFLYHRRHGLDLHLHGSEGFLGHLLEHMGRLVDVAIGRDHFHSQNASSRLGFRAAAGFAVCRRPPRRGYRGCSMSTGMGF